MALSVTQYEAIFREAIIAADKAAHDWLANAKPQYEVYSGAVSYGTLLDVCGNAWLEPKDKRQKHIRTMRAYPSLWDSFLDKPRIRLTNLGRRQEKGLHVAAMEAANEVLKKHGIDCFKVYSYTD